MPQVYQFSFSPSVSVLLKSQVYQIRSLALDCHRHNKPYPFNNYSYWRTDRLISLIGCNNILNVVYFDIMYSGHKMKNISLFLLHKVLITYLSYAWPISFMWMTSPCVRRMINVTYRAIMLVFGSTRLFLSSEASSTHFKYPAITSNKVRKFTVTPLKMNWNKIFQELNGWQPCVCFLVNGVYHKRHNCAPRRGNSLLLG